MARSLHKQSGLNFVIFPLAFLLAFACQAAERQVLTGHVPAAAAVQTPVNRLAASQQLHLAISLPLRNRASLDTLLQQLYDPASPNFHHFLSPAQFTAAFGTQEKDYQTVINFAKASGLNVTATHPNRLLLEVSAPVANIEKFLHVHMGVYQHPTEPRTFFSPDIEPSLDLDVPVLFVAGLNDYQIPHANVHARPLARGQKVTRQGGSEVLSTYIGQDFRNAYVPGVTLTGAGQSVGLLEFDDFYATDVTDYLNDPNSGLAGSSVVVSNAAVTNMTGYPQGGEAEVALDIDMAISMAPGLASVIVYEAPASASYADALLDHMADDDICQQMSCSWSGFYDAGVEQAFLQFATQGQSFFIASGDSGAYYPSRTLDPPCDDTNITVVGGTTLSTTGPQGSWLGETTWSWFTQPFDGLDANAGSGGSSPTYHLPTWQQGISMSGNMGSTTRRNIPDVAMVANEIFWYDSDGQPVVGGGTSAAAPLWAGFTALVNQHGAAHHQSTLGFLNPALYAIGKGANYTSDFHDVATGNNTNASISSRFFAETGYDLCTGWGSPNGSNMINALLPGLSLIAPTVAWTNLASITYGTALTATQLSATTSVAGTFAFNPAAGAILNAGTNVLSAVFTPIDTFDYNTVTNTVTLVVTPVPLTVTASNTSRVYGQANPVFSAGYTGFVNGDGPGVLSGSPSLTTTATAASTVAGSPYAIVATNGTLSANNYSFLFNNGQLTITPANSVNTISSSRNPAAPGSNVTFIATLTAAAPGSGTPTGTIQFYADSAALGSPVSLVGGAASISTSSLSTATHVISNLYTGDGNFFGSSGTLSPNQSITTFPTAATISLPCYTNSGVKISVAALLAQDSDPNNEVLTLVSAGPASTNGGTVAVSENWIFYTSAPGATNADAFPYVITNTDGLLATGTVSIPVAVDLSQSQNIVAVQDLGNGSSLIQFQGIPGRTYSIQYTESLQSPVWLTLGTSTANSTGAFAYTDSPGSGAPPRFYRSTNP